MLRTDTVIGYVHDSDVEAIAQQHPNRLRRKPTISAVREAPDARLLQHLLLGEAAGGVLLEYAPHDRRAFRVGHQTFPLSWYNADPYSIALSEVLYTHSGPLGWPTWRLAAKPIGTGSCHP